MSTSMAGPSDPAIMSAGALPSPRADTSLTIAACAMALLILVGGANDSYASVRLVAQLIGAAFLCAAFVGGRLDGGIRAPDWLIFALPVLILVQLIPVPPGWGADSPLREVILRDDQLILGRQPWRPLSLDPERTLRMVFALLPILGVYAFVRRGSLQAGRMLANAIVSAAVLTMILAALQQAMSQDASWIYPYSRADRAFAIGIFTNHNHQALFLAATIPVAAWRLTARGEVLRALDLAKLIVLATLCLIFAALTASRTGLLLTAFSAVATGILMAMRRVPSHRTALGIALVVSLVAGGIGALAASGSLGRFGAAFERRDIAEDSRLVFWPQSAALVEQSWPQGTGYGTFSAIYAIEEDPATRPALNVNHAHQDYLEVLIEGGLPAAIVLGAGLVWFGVTGTRLLLGKGARDGDLFAALVLLLIMLHSLVDYPLRTPAFLGLAGWAAATLARNRGSPRSVAKIDRSV